jgi:filamentous hemagglutinin
MLAEAGNGSGVGSTRAGNTGEKELVKNPDGTMEFSGTGNSVKSPKPSSLSDVEARRWYLDSEAKIPEMIDKTQSLEQQAQQASTLRNQFRTQARNAMSNRDGADALFGSNPNMTWEQVVEKYTNRGYSGDELYQEIINASQKSNAGVNSSLGIEP